MHITYITLIFYITHIQKLIFKAYTNIIKKLIAIFFYSFFPLYIEMTNNYYQKLKEKLQKEVTERYQNLFEEEKERKHQYHRERNKNLSEE